jgi:hypothetical protein
MEAHMERLIEEFIERQNIAHYADLLKTETDPIKCKTLRDLMAEEQGKLARYEGSIAAPPALKRYLPTKTS